MCAVYRSSTVLCVMYVYTSRAVLCELFVLGHHRGHGHWQSVGGFTGVQGGPVEQAHPVPEHDQTLQGEEHL